MPMSDRMYEQTRDKILGKTNEDDSTATPLEPLEEWGAKRCKAHAEIIKAQKQTIETLNRVIESLRARLAERGAGR